MELPDDGRHLDAETVAAYVEGLLERPRQEETERHLATCRACRDEVVEVRGLLAAQHPAVRRLRLFVPLAAAAAALLMVGVPLARTWNVEANQPAVARTPEERSGGLSVVAPLPDASVASGTSPRFVWHAADPGSRFTLTLVDDGGAALWTIETGDTSVALPPDVSLSPGRTYFWYVDALGTDGRSLTSGATRFVVR